MAANTTLPKRCHHINWNLTQDPRAEKVFLAQKTWNYINTKFQIITMIVTSQQSQLTTP